MAAVEVNLKITRWEKNLASSAKITVIILPISDTRTNTVAAVIPNRHSSRIVLEAHSSIPNEQRTNSNA